MPDYDPKEESNKRLKESLKKEIGKFSDHDLEITRREFDKVLKSGQADKWDWRGKDIVNKEIRRRGTSFGKELQSRLPRGVKLSPSGDIGQHRQVEGRIVGGFKGPILSASSYFKKGR